jgi:hypothetical protein
MLVTLERIKPQNQAHLIMDLGGESKGKEPQRVQAYTPTKSQRERPRNGHKRIAKSSENHQKGKMRGTQPSLEEPRQIIYTYH